MDIKTLSPFYISRLNTICKDNNLTEEDLLFFFINYYYLDSTKDLKVLIKQLTSRLFKGVDKTFIIYLKALYAAIGHFLKKLRYI